MNCVKRNRIFNYKILRYRNAFVLYIIAHFLFGIFVVKPKQKKLEQLQYRALRIHSEETE